MKVGDEVEVINGDYSFTKPGSKGKVIGILTKEKREIRVEFSKMIVQPGSGDHIWDIEYKDLKIIKYASPPTLKDAIDDAVRELK